MLKSDRLTGTILAQERETGKEERPCIPWLKTRGFLAHFCNTTSMLISMQPDADAGAAPGTILRPVAGASVHWRSDDWWAAADARRRMTDALRARFW